ncbi:MAG TPA: AI-2E family transporter [bacterium]
MKRLGLPDRGQWVAVFFFICFGWIAYQTFLLAKPFLPGVLGAAMLGILFSPLYQRVLRKVQKPNTAAVILTIGIILLTVLPLVCMGWMVLKEAETLRPTLAGFIENYRTPSYVQGLLDPLFSFFESFHIELKPMVLDKAAEIGAQMSSGGAQLAGHIVIMLFNGLVLMLMLFFVFRDGKKAAEMILSGVPMSPQNKQALLKRLYETFRAVVAGVFVTAVTEGLADMIGFFLAGVPLPIFFSLAVAVFSLLGASVLITIPAAFWVLNHDTGWGIFLLVWGILVSVLSDNVLKPALIGSQARMPFLLMLFSTFGGIKLYGVMGLFLGPIVVTAFLTFWGIYRKDYKT